MPLINRPPAYYIHLPATIPYMLYKLIPLLFFTSIFHLHAQMADLQNLTYKIYQGSWRKMPDLSQINPSTEGKSPDGLVDIKVAEAADDFAMLFEGDLIIPEDGDYIFVIGSDDGSMLLLDGKEAINNDGIHHLSQAKNTTVHLKKGTVKFELRYFNKTGQQGLELVWKAQTAAEFKALTVTAKTIKAAAAKASRKAP